MSAAQDSSPTNEPPETTGRTLIEKWRRLSAEQAQWSRESAAKHDGANAHTERARARIYRECADDLEALIPLPVSSQVEEAEKWVMCEHPERNRTGGNDYLECGDCGFRWDYRQQFHPRAHAIDALIAAVRSSSAPSGESGELARLKAELAKATQAHIGALETGQRHYCTAMEQEKRAEKAEADLVALRNHTTALLDQERRRWYVGVEQAFGLPTNALEGLAPEVAAATLRAAQTPTPGWQPIETAPKDETRVLLCCTDGDGNNPRCEVGVWTSTYGGSWWDLGMEYTFDHPTHWMPLPSPPPSQEPTA